MGNKNENREIKIAENEMLMDKNKTIMKKSQFIDEIKSGLGAKIKAKPRATIIKRPWYYKMLNTLKKIFKTL
jgi:hypothetical protein